MKGSPDERARKDASKIYPLRKKGNLLLCTLLLGNTLVNAYMAVLLADATDGLVGTALTTGLILIFGAAAASKRRLDVSRTSTFRDARPGSGAEPRDAPSGSEPSRGTRPQARSSPNPSARVTAYASARSRRHSSGSSSRSNSLSATRCRRCSTGLWGARWLRSTRRMS